MVTFKEFTKKPKNTIDYNNRIVAVIDSFDPIHKGHLKTFELAQQTANAHDATVVAIAIDSSDSYSLLDTRIDILKELYPTIDVYGTVNFNNALEIIKEQKHELIGLISEDAPKYVSTVGYVLGDYIKQHATFIKDPNTKKFNDIYFNKNFLVEMVRTENIHKFYTLVPYDKKTAKIVYEEIRGNLM